MTHTLDSSDSDTQTLDLGSGQTLEVRREGETSRVRVLARGGKSVLTLRITEDGPVLSAPEGLAIEAEGDLELSGKRVAIRAEEGLSVRTGGDVSVDADGDVRSVGRTQTVQSRLGNVDLKANDDVTAQGERVRLNC